MPILTQYTEAKPSKTGNPQKALPFYPNSFSQDQALKAIQALAAHHGKHREEKEGGQLIMKDEHVWLTVALKEIPKKGKWSVKPVRIAVPFSPLPPPPATSVAIIAKPPQRATKDLIFGPSLSAPSSSSPIKFISRVVDTTKLRGKHAPYEARRKLCNEYDVWLCDERLVPSLPKLLGKTWLDERKQPVPVNLQRKDLKEELARAINSAVFMESKGTSNAIRIATASHHTPSQILENLLTAIPQIMRAIPNGWNNVLSLGIKTSGSAMLPIWRCELGYRYEEWRPVEERRSERVKREEAGKQAVVEGDKVDTEEGMQVEQEEVETPKTKSTVAKGKEVDATLPVTIPAATSSKPVSINKSKPEMEKRRKPSALKSGLSVKEKVVGKSTVKKGRK